jgi:glycosyltransferase involved in cell wall biosynthesis
MKVAYVSCEDPQDVHAWSGLVYHIGHSLEPYAEVSYAGPLAHRRFLADKARQLVCEKVSGKRHRRGREPWLLKHYAEQARPKVASDADAVLACSTLPVAYLECAQPVVVWIDSTFGGLVDYHPEFHKLCAHTLAMGNAAEQRALERCRRVIFASEWAARTARQHYRLDEQKVEVVPFGANLETAPGTAEVRAAVRGRSRSACRLLLVGVDWQQKGADVAVEVATELRAAGVPAELTIVGCQAPAGTAVPEWVRVTGFISQKSKEGQARLAELYREAHFLLLPTRSECYGLVVAEANAFGVPAVVSNTGGIPINAAGANGVRIGLERFVEETVAYVGSHWRNPARYAELAESSRQEFETRLNWRVSGARVAEILRECGERGERARQPASVAEN